MKILISVGGFFPAQKYGGPAVSIKNMSDLLCCDAEIYIVTSNHELGTQEKLAGISEGWNLFGNYYVNYLAENEITESKLKKIVEDVQPDCIYVNSLFDYRFTAPFTRIAARKKIPLVLTPRGELCPNAFNRKLKKLPYIWLLRKYWGKPNFFFESTAEDELAQIQRYLVKNKNQVFYLPNVPSIACSHPHSKKTDKYLSIIFLARLQRKKNLLGALKILQHVRVPVRFDIYGPKEVPEYWEKCQSLIDAMPENVRVTYQGAVSHAEVSGILQNYDLYFFPTYSENYGHSIIEALQAGTPVLISDQTPWKDLKNENAGWALPLDDMDAFVNAIESVFYMNTEGYRNMSSSALEYVKNKLNIDEIKRMYLEMFNIVIEK